MSIRVENLSRIYGKQRAVDDISFEVEPGQVVGFLGPNGAGKSTTMKILTGFIPQTSGGAWVCGYDVSTEPIQVKRRTGYLPENNPLYLDMYVREYLRFIAGLNGMGKRARSQSEEVIELTGLNPEAHKKARQLSKGYRQRLGLAQALIHNPEVLILDEPTSGLDPLQLEEIRQLIRTIGQERTVMLSTHVMQEVQAVCDRVIIINKGKLVADDRTDRLVEQMGSGQTIRVVFQEMVSMELLHSIPGIEKVSESGGEYLLFSDTSIDIRGGVSRFAAEKGLTLLKLVTEETSLEDVFKELTK